MAGLFGGVASYGGSSGLTMADRAAVFLAAMNGDYAGAMKLKAMPALKAQQAAAQQAIASRMDPSYQDGPGVSLAPPQMPGGGPAPGGVNLPGMGQPAAPQSQIPDYQAPVRTQDGLNIDSPDLAKLMFQADQSGVPVDSLLKVLQARQPHMMSAQDGTLINDKSSKYEGMQFPKLDNGIISQRAPDGRLLGASALPGYASAAASIAGATTNAQESTKAAYDLVPVPQSDGSTRLMPRSLALAAMTRGGAAPGGMGGQGGMGGAGGAMPGGPAFGVSQTPAEAELAKARAGTQGKNETDIAGARAAMQQVDDQTNMIAQNLHDMLGEAQDPNTGKWVKAKPSMVTGLSAGSGTDLIEHVPFLNQQAKDLAAKIETVRNGTSFNSLQAIKNALSAAGDGGSGSIRMTDQTARMLGEINGSLNQNQSGQQFEDTVRRHLSQLDALNKARHDLFESQYNGIRPTTPGQTGPTASYAKPAPPQPGQVVKGYRFLGGNPADPKSWAK